MQHCDDYEYRGLKAAAWDLLRGDYSTWPDRPFYRDIIRSAGEPALDVGCGTGRLILDYLAAGLDVDGVDNSPEMLDVCRQKAAALGLVPALYQQSMQSLDLPRRYRTIFVPSSSFQLLTALDDAREAIRRFLNHLHPGGRLVMPFMVLATASSTPAGEPDEWRLMAEARRGDDGALVRRWGRSAYDLDQQLEHTEDRYELLIDGAVVTTELHSRSPATRWYTQDQAMSLFRDTGFADLHAVREFTRDTAGAGDRIFSVFGTRP